MYENTTEKDPPIGSIVHFYDYASIERYNNIIIFDSRIYYNIISQNCHYSVAVTCIHAYRVRIVNGRGFSRNPINAQVHRDFMASWVKSKLEQKLILAAGRESLPCLISC